MIIHDIKTLCPPLAGIINKAHYSFDSFNMHRWVSKGKLSGKAMAEVKAFAEEVKDVRADGHGRYIFIIEGYEFDLKISKLNYILNVMRSA